MNFPVKTFCNFMKTYLAENKDGAHRSVLQRSAESYSKNAGFDKRQVFPKSFSKEFSSKILEISSKDIVQDPRVRKNLFGIINKAHKRDPKGIKDLKIQQQIAWYKTLEDPDPDSKQMLVHLNKAADRLAKQGKMGESLIETRGPEDMVDWEKVKAQGKTLDDIVIMAAEKERKARERMFNVPMIDTLYRDLEGNMARGKRPTSKEGFDQILNSLHAGSALNALSQDALNKQNTQKRQAKIIPFRRRVMGESFTDSVPSDPAVGPGIQHEPTPLEKMKRKAPKRVTHSSTTGNR
jgi:hypothetical protein